MWYILNNKLEIKILRGHSKGLSSSIYNDSFYSKSKYQLRNPAKLAHFPYDTLQELYIGNKCRVCLRTIRLKLLMRFMLDSAYDCKFKVNVLRLINL